MLSKILEAELDSIANGIKQSLASENVNAFGTLSRSIQVVVTENNDFVKGQVLAERYIDTVDKGRKPTTNFTGGLLQAIQAWLQLGKYGLDSNNKGLAYAITRNITKFGTKTFREGKDRNIVKSNFTEERLQKIIDKLQDEIYFNFKIK